MDSEVSSLNVLIVDDSAIVRRAVRKAVRQAGVSEDRIREAENGQVALDRLDEELPDIVFLDVNMPVMDGEQFLEAIERDGRVRDLTVIIVSTEMNAKRLLRLAELGARARLRKPFEPEQLREILLDTVAQRQ